MERITNFDFNKPIGKLVCRGYTEYISSEDSQVERKHILNIEVYYNAKTTKSH